MKIIIIGGGASGLSAAICAGRCGADVTVLESSSKAGRKILASGNGRCNLMNSGKPVYFGDARFAENLITNHKSRLTAFFDSIGLALAEEERGRVYPATGRARDVLETLLDAAERCGVSILYDKKATGISYEQGVRKGRFTVSCESGERYTADRVIVCCGGMAGLHLGHDGSAYSLLSESGHRLIAPRPALAAIDCVKKLPETLDGLRCPARLTLTRGEKIIAVTAGEILFSARGISGVCAMQLGSEVTGRDETVYIDFSPVFFPDQRKYERCSPPYPPLLSNEKAVTALLEKRKAQFGAENMLTGLLPGPLARIFSHLPFDRAVRSVCAWPHSVRGNRGMDGAQVTRGGIETDTFDPDTCESLLQKGLYACGEVLNVDGDCGGFNLQFAFLCGILAGTDAAKNK